MMKTARSSLLKVNPQTKRHLAAHLYKQTIRGIAAEGETEAL